MILCVFLLNIIVVHCQLYSEYDNVNIFDSHSFEKKFTDFPDNNWLIHFYSSFCGHCINFSPIFKEFLKEAQYWNKVIRFGVVECSRYKKLCNKQEVEYYPFFKVFLKESFHKSSKGEKVELSYSNLYSVFKSVLFHIKKLIRPPQLIETSPDTKIKVPEYILLVGGNRVDLERTILTFDGRLKYPILYIHEKNKHDYSATLKEGSQALSKRFLNIDMVYRWLPQYARPNTDIYNLNSVELHNETKTPNDTISIIPLQVYNKDILSSIYYSFNYEISDADLKNVENNIILLKFVQKLFLYSDINEELTNIFKKIMELLQRNIVRLNYGSKLILSWPKILQLSGIPTMNPSWIGCNGSSPHFRRYPCGLWTLFHTMTVNYHVKVIAEEIADDDSLDLIKSIRKFIITFFKCHECAENFKRETAHYKKHVTDSAEAVLYLWRIHNSVNKRLAKAPSEDPSFPKIAFPPLITCVSCRTKKNVTWPMYEQWSQRNVLTFLVRHYSKRITFVLKRNI